MKNCSWVVDDVQELFVVKANFLNDHESNIEKIGLFEKHPK
jgi:hypothetical protein